MIAIKSDLAVPQCEWPFNDECTEIVEEYSRERKASENLPFDDRKGRGVGDRALPRVGPSVH